MPDHPPLKFAAIGLDHRHIYHQVGRLWDSAPSARATTRAIRRCRSTASSGAFPTCRACATCARCSRIPRSS